jgi:asparagine synthase (glutamine-hydrolysing)
MCGIYGVFDYKNAQLGLDDLEAMGDSIRMRGPDDKGIYQDEKVLLGHNRLSIIDLTKNGRQPLSNEDKTVWISFNGEIYNYLNLKSQLSQRHSFCSKTDSEVIIHAFEEMGESLWEKLEGMFAFALWDQKNKTFYLVRDHFGIKPLFYTYHKGSLVFASQIKAILSLKSFPVEYNFQGLANYFTYFYIPGPETLVKNIQHIPPGHFLKLSNNKISIHKYHQLKFNINKDFNYKQLQEDIIPSHIGRCIRSSMISDVPIGLLLSGGIDSNILLSEMVKYYDQTIHTFTLSFVEPSYNEGHIANISAELFKTSHHSEKFCYENFDSQLTDIILGLDCLNANPGLIMIYQFFKLASRHSKVVLMGNGGDELFAGYETYRANRYLKIFQALPEFIRMGLLKASDLVPTSYDKYSTSYIFKRFIEGSFWEAKKAHAYWRSIFTEEEKKQLLDVDYYKGDIIQMDASYKYLEKFNEVEGSFQDKALYADFKLFLGDNGLIMADHLSMHFSLEVRPPLLDQNFVKFAFSIPFKYKFNNGKSKTLLRKAYKDKLPKQVLKMKKHGTVCPMGAMFRSGLRNYVDHELGKSFLNKFAFINGAYIQKIKDDHFSGRQDNGFKIWSLLCLGKWHDIFYSKS